MLDMLSKIVFCIVYSNICHWYAYSIAIFQNTLSNINILLPVYSVFAFANIIEFLVFSIWSEKHIYRNSFF